MREGKTSEFFNLHFGGKKQKKTVRITRGRSKKGERTGHSMGGRRKIYMHGVANGVGEFSHP